MRFIVLIKSTAEDIEGIMPSAESIKAIDIFNRELIEAVITLGGDRSRRRGTD